MKELMKEWREFLGKIELNEEVGRRAIASWLRGLESKKKSSSSKPKTPTPSVHNLTMGNFLNLLKTSKSKTPPSSPSNSPRPVEVVITKSQEELTGNFCANPANEGKPVTGLPSFICRGGTAVNTASPPSNVGRDYLIAFVFPDFEPRLDPGKTLSVVEKAGIFALTGETPKPGRCGKVGHAGVIVIQKDGNVTLAEFGRYNVSKEGQGRIMGHNLGPIAKFSSKGQLLNARQVTMEAKKWTRGDGPNLKMIAALIPIQENKIKNVLDFIKRKEILEYDLFDRTPGGGANCGTFANDAALAAGAGIDPSSVSPLPIKMIESLRSVAEDYFEV